MKTKIGRALILSNVRHWMSVPRNVRDTSYTLSGHILVARTAILVAEDRLSNSKIWENMK